MIYGHRDFIVFGLMQIFLNAAKREYNDGATINIKIRVDPDTKYVTLIIYQNKPFHINEGHHYSGIDKEIKPIFHMFCGSDNLIFSDRNESYYEIKIIFNDIRTK